MISVVKTKKTAKNPNKNNYINQFIYTIIILLFKFLFKLLFRLLTYYYFNNYPILFSIYFSTIFFNFLLNIIIIQSTQVQLMLSCCVFRCLLQIILFLFAIFLFLDYISNTFTFCHIFQNLPLTKYYCK